MTIRIAEHIIGELGRYNRASGDTMSMFQCPAEFGDTRRATVSTSDAHDGSVSLMLNFRPQSRIFPECCAIRSSRSACCAQTIRLPDP
jgi:hypothetical protein